MNEALPSSADGSGGTKSLARRSDFVLGNVTVRPSLRKLDGPLGSQTGEPRVMQVLVALADARGAVLSRDDLLRLCWEGRIVGDDAVNRAIAEVRRIAAAVGAGLEVVTVPRVGYRLVGVEWNEQSAAEPASLPTLAINRRKLVAGGVASLALLAGGSAALVYRRREAEIDALIERGRALQGTDNFTDDRRAEALFRQAIGRAPDRADAWGWLASVVDDQAKAREAAGHALSLNPREPNARVVLAYQRRDLDAWTQWEDALLSVLHDAPDNVRALTELTMFYQGMGRCKASWETNERALRVEPFNPAHQHRRALKHWIFGRLGEADKVADQALRLWPRHPTVWNARMLIYACTDRAPAALTLLDDVASLPVNIKPPSIDSWRAGLIAIASRSSEDISRALQVCTYAAVLAPGLAANAIMLFSYLGQLDAAYRIAEGLFEGRGTAVQKVHGKGMLDVYSGTDWGRSQFLFIPATASFRADQRFPDLCRRMGQVAYWRKRDIWPDIFVRGAIDPAKLA